MKMESDPIRLFNTWFADANSKVKKLPERAALATASAKGRPTCRMVLLKNVNEKGFVFYTNYNSPKAREIEENPFAALTFHWVETGRQVRIEGKVEKVSPEESDDYFATRPRQSQLGAWASEQSVTLASRFALLRQVIRVAARFMNKPVQRPAHWGGYCIIPDSMEFWEEKPFRLHDRFLYKRNQHGDWQRKRLSP
ncbi:MAG: pyridoxamine 5'-phosphate oxidase [Flavobacteriales bacterium]